MASKFAEAVSSVVASGPFGTLRPVVDSIPAAGPRRVVDSTPAVGSSPAVDPTPPAGSRRVVDSTPAVGSSPAVDPTPPAGLRPAVDSRPVCAGRLVVDSMPTVLPSKAGVAVIPRLALVQALPWLSGYPVVTAAPVGARARRAQPVEGAGAERGVRNLTATGGPAAWPAARTGAIGPALVRIGDISRFVPARGLVPIGRRIKAQQLAGPWRLVPTRQLAPARRLVPAWQLVPDRVVHRVRRLVGAVVAGEIPAARLLDAGRGVRHAAAAAFAARVRYLVEGRQIVEPSKSRKGNEPVDVAGERIRFG
jgi:hypothetical protein